jgi:16S rRNA (adenine1518-N6/adenine1519-N6)-dimethyltransferase
MIEPRPKKSFGQHFLTDLGAALAIAEAAAPSPRGTVLEIGPGKGVLTRHLLDRGVQVVAIERDRELIPLLREVFADALRSGQLALIEDDAATADWGAALARGPGPWRIAGNIPYNITGRLLERAVHHASRVDAVVFMVQKEVADRVAAPPDSEHYGALSVFVQAAFSVDRVRLVRRGSFFPPPKVDSAVLLLTSSRPPLAEETDLFRELVKRAFSARRKTLRNAWKGLRGLTSERLHKHAASAGLSLDARGETLSVLDFDRMARALASPDPT